MAKASMLVKNRPLGHYVLSVYSLLFRGYCIDDKNDIITLIAPSRSVGRTTDLANMLARVCAPGLLWLSPKRTKISNRLQNGDVYPKVSNLIVDLTCFNRKQPPGDTINQSDEIEKAFNNYDNRRKQGEKPISKPEYTVIEAMTSYREEQPGVSLGEFEHALRGIQNEFQDRIKKAKGKKSDEWQKFNICELEFILSTLLKNGCKLHFTCPDKPDKLEIDKPNKWKIELKFTPDEQEQEEKGPRKIGWYKEKKNWILKDREGKKTIIEINVENKKVVSVSEKITQIKIGDKVEKESFKLNEEGKLTYNGKVICKNPKTKFMYAEVQKKGDKGKKWFDVPGEDIELGKVFLDGENIKYTPLSASLPVTIENCHYLKTSIEEALMRMGLLPSSKLKELAKDMSRYDDVLIGLDTNCFYHGITTASLLDSFVGVARYPYLDTPNWITLIASVISTGEIEHKANACKDYFDDKDTQGAHDRRIAFRALQEFMEISTCADLEGVSMLLTGEISPDIDFSGGNTIRDELIRKQIKNFLSNIGFHTGAYFLTGDRKCAMFARAESLHAVHLTRKPLDITKDIPLTDLSPKNCGDEQDIHNVSELVYELGVEFPLKITCKNKDCGLSGLSFIVRTDWEGKSLEEWENRNFMVRFVESNENMYGQFYTCLKENVKAVKLGQLLWAWQQVNARHHEAPGYPGWTT